MKKILISGGSGLVGSALTKRLEEGGHDVAILSRNPEDKGQVKAYGWDVKKGFIDPKALEGVEIIIHLAGAGIADKRWTSERKKTIIDSRVESAKLLRRAVKEQGMELEAFISASGINYYGSNTTDHIFEETDPPAGDFIGRCCKKWEAAADLFAPDSRVVKMRTGVVLSRKGGALEKIAKPVKLGLGAPIGSGKQYMPYLHIDDLCAMYAAAIENPEMTGAYNACNGDHINNKELTHAIARALNKSMWAPNVPAFALKLVFGEMASILLGGSRASAEKVRKDGVDFGYDGIDAALAAIYG